MIQNRPNPLLALPPNLDPTLPWNDLPAEISKERFEASIALAVQAANAQIATIKGPPPGGFTLPELKEYLKIDPNERKAMFEAVSLIFLQ